MQRSLSWFGSKGVTEITRFASRDDFAAILKNWQSFCYESGLILPMTAIAELNKRSKKSANDECKAKLDLSSCSLEDGHVIALFQALAIAPVVAKLDLSKNNLTDEAGLCIISLLKGQINLTSELDLDDIADIPFLGEIALSEGMSAKIKNDIQLLTAKLKETNARGYIRQLHNKICEGGSMDATSIAKIIKEISGKSPDKTVIVGILTEGKVNNSYEHAYDALESICLQSLADNGTIELLTQRREDELIMLLNSLEQGPVDPDDEPHQDIQHATDEGYEVVDEEYVDSPVNNEIQKSPQSYKRNSEIDDAITTSPAPAASPAKPSTPTAAPARPSVSPSSPLMTSQPTFLTAASPMKQSTALMAQPSPSPQQARLSINSTGSTAAAQLSPQVPPPPPANSSPLMNNPRASYIANLLAKVNTPGLASSNSVEPSPMRTTVATTTLPPPAISPQQIAQTSTIAPVLNSTPVQAKHEINDDDGDDDEEEEEEDDEVQPENEEENLPEEELVPEDTVVTSAAKSPKTPPTVTPPRKSNRGTPTSSRPNSPRRMTPSKSIEFPSDLGETRIAIHNAVESGCLDLFGSDLHFINLTDILPVQSLKAIRILVLRSNSISDFEGAQLPILCPGLTELDIGNNTLNGAIPVDALPTSLLKLNISQNNLSDITGVLSCVHLRTLIAYNNLIKTVHGLPPALEILDLSDNLISAVSSLRAIASFSTKITTFGIAGNPVYDTNLRVKLHSMLPCLQELDGEPLPGSKIRKAKLAGELTQNASIAVTEKSPIRISKKQQLAADKRRTEYDVNAAKARAKQQKKDSKPKLSASDAKELLTRLTRPREVPKMPTFVDICAPAPKMTKTKKKKPSNFGFAQPSGSPIQPPTPAEIEAIKVIDKWMQKCNGDIGAAVTLLDEAFWIANNSDNVEAATAKRFSTSVKRLSLIQDRFKVFPEINTALEALNKMGDTERRENCSAISANLQALASVLSDVEAAMTFCNSYSLSVEDLKTSIAVTMKKPEGVHVTDNILKQFNVDYNWDDEKPVPPLPASPGNEKVNQIKQSPSLGSPTQKLSNQEIDLYMDNLKSRLTARAKKISLQSMPSPSPNVEPKISEPESNAPIQIQEETAVVSTDEPWAIDTTFTLSDPAATTAAPEATITPDPDPEFGGNEDAQTSIPINEIPRMQSDVGVMSPSPAIDSDSTPTYSDAGAAPQVDSKMSLKDRLKARLKK